MKLITFSFIVFGLIGCGSFKRELARFSGYSTVCVDGVEYIQFSSGASVKYNTDGSIKICP